MCCQILWPSHYSFKDHFPFTYTWWSLTMSITLQMMLLHHESEQEQDAVHPSLHLIHIWIHSALQESHYILHIISSTWYIAKTPRECWGYVIVLTNVFCGILSHTVVVPFSSPSIGPLSEDEEQAFTDIEDAIQSGNSLQLWDGQFQLWDSRKSLRL